MRVSAVGTRPSAGNRARRAPVVVALCLATFVAVAGVAPAATAARRPRTERSTVSAVDTAFVNAAFHDLVSHGPSASSSSYWTGRLASGATTRPALLSYLAGSPAAARASLIYLYFRILQRAPDDASLASWTTRITSHHATVDSVAKTFLASNEFYQRVVGGSTSNWVNQLYWLVLEHGPTTAQSAHWVSLAGTQGLTVTAAQFYDSAGARTRRVDLLYARLLHRAPSGASLAHWVDVERAGDAAVAVPLAESAEYLTVAQTRHDPRLTSPLTAVVHLGVWVSVPITPYTYLGPAAIGVVGVPPGLTSVVGTGLVGTPTHAGTFHTYVVVADASDVVIDTVTVTELA